MQTDGEGGVHEATLRESIAAGIANWCMDRPWLVVVGAAFLTVVSGWATSQLDIVTDLKKLIPDDFPSVVRLDMLTERAGNQADVIVTIESQDPDGNLRYAQRLSKLFETDERIRFVRFHRDLESLESRALLYLTVPQLEDIRGDVVARIRKEVKKDLDLGLGDDDEEDGGAAGNGGGPGASATDDDRAKGETEKALDEFEEDDFGTPAPAPDAATKEKAPPETVPAGAGPEGKGATEKALDDFEEDDFGAPSPTAEAAGGATGEPAADDLAAMNVEELKAKYGVEDVPEYYRNDDGTMVVFRARPFVDTSDTAKSREIVQMARDYIEKARAADDPGDLEIVLKGHHLERTEEVKSLQGNLALSASVCLGLLLLTIGVYFRRIRAVVLISVPLVMSVVWSLGLAWVFYRFLNIISAFIFAVLLGLGIDFGIHVLARYDEARRAGLDARRGMRVALCTSGLSAATGAFTTAVVFFLLTVGDFQGFAQFGLVAGCGVIVSLVAVFTVMPALLILFERVRPWREAATRPTVRRRSWAPKGRLAAGLAFGAFSLSLFLAAFAAIHLGDVEFEYAFDKLGSRSKLAAEAALEARLEQARAEGREDEVEDPERYKDIIGRYTTGAPTIVMTDDLQQTERVYRQFETMLELPPAVKAALWAARKPEDLRHPDLVAALAALPDGDPARHDIEAALAEVEHLLTVYPLDRLRNMIDRLNDVLSIYRFVPEHQAEKLPIIEDIRRRLEAKKAVFEGKDRERVDEFLEYLSPQPLDVAGLPGWIRVQFREPTGKEGRFLVLYTKGSKSDIQNTLALKGAYFDLKDPGTGGEVPTAATYYVLPEIMETIRDEGPLIIGLALAGLFIILLVFFRSLVQVGLVLMPLLFSVLWAVGLMPLIDLKLNFYNVVVVPLLLGMGIDHGVHIYSRYVEQGRRDLAVVLRETGSAIWMAVFTTMIGFAGMFFADHVGLESMAELAIVGMGLAFLASVVTLPAMLYLGRLVREARSRRSRAAAPAQP